MTTPYHIKIAPAAQRQLFAFAPRQQKSMIKLIETLAINPRPMGTRKIEGMMGLYSQDFMQVRLIYKVEDQEVLILMIK